MKIPKSAIFVAGLSIALFLITLLVISITAHQENAAKPKPAEKQPAPILLEYKPNDKIYLILRGSNENKNASESQKIITSDYSLYNGSTIREITYTHWINLYFDTRQAEIKNNKLILTSSIYINTYPNEGAIPFLADEFYVENGKLWHASVIMFNPSDIDKKTLLSLQNNILEYKHKKYNDDIHKLEEGTRVIHDLLILALCEKKEAIQLLKDYNVYDKYFNVELDGAYLEVYTDAAGAYEAYEYLHNQGGSIKEVIPLDSASSSVQHK